jgi:hypothetical protein
VKRKSFKQFPAKRRCVVANLRIELKSYIRKK